ncbi:MAG: hypothetical protein LUE93_11815 [Bacteroides sp.]|nr:hypothetical protein [Bacteroides sp.]
MKVKTRLSLYCSLIFGIIFALVSISIYQLYSHTVQRSIYNNLRKTAWVAAWFYLEEDELTEKEFEKVKQQFKEVDAGVVYQLYDVHNIIVFGEPSHPVPGHFVEKIRSVKQMSFKTENDFCYGMFYTDNQGDFVVIAKEDRSALGNQVQLLLWILIPAFLSVCSPLYY